MIKKFFTDESLNTFVSEVKTYTDKSELAITERIDGYFETVGSDTLTWDGNTEDVYNVLGMSYHISDAVPTLEDLQKGGHIVLSNGDEYDFTADDVIDPAQLGAGNGCYLIFTEGNSLPMAGVAFEPNASFTGTYQGQVITATFEKTGIYFSYEPTYGIYPTALTINGYTEFNKREVLKNEYLNILEKVGDNTLTWDGNTEGLYNIRESLYHVSDIVPTLEDMKNGGTIKFVENGEPVIYPFTFEDITSMGSDIVMLLDGLVTVIFKPNTTYSETVENETFSVTFEKSGIYFAKDGEENCINSLAINDYSFAKETIKEEYLPKQSWNNLNDKPFEAEFGEIKLYPTTTIAFERGSIQLPDVIEIEEGKEYIITYDGVKYKCISKHVTYEGMGACVLGNYKPLLDSMGIENDAVATDEPFGMAIVDKGAAILAGFGMWIFADPTNTEPPETEEHIMSIGYEGEIVHHLDPKFVKDMYYTKSSKVELLPMTTLEFSNAAILPDNISLIKGNEYEVIWNGVSYIRKAKFINDDGETAIYLGNINALQNTGSTGEPFAVFYSDSTSVIIPIDESVTAAEVSIYEVIEEVHQIDKKYIPDCDLCYEKDVKLCDVTEKEAIDFYGAATVFMLPYDETEVNSDTKAIVKFDYTKTDGTTESIDQEFEIDYSWYGDYEDYPENAYEVNIGSNLIRITNGAAIGNTNTHDVCTVMLLDAGYESLSLSIKYHVLKKLDEKFLPESTKFVGKKTENGEIFNDYEDNIASGNYSHAEGIGTTASGDWGSHAEGYYTTASGNYSHTEGRLTVAFGEGSHAEGYSINSMPSTITPESTNDEIIAAWNTEKFTLAAGPYSHAEGRETLTFGWGSHSEGYHTIASGGNGSHAEGNGTIASGGNGSHAEGYCTEASGNISHAEGSRTIASGDESHAEGCRTIAAGDYQHVQGKYNIEDTEGKYAHIVGNGTDGNRKNAHTLDWSGNAWFAGEVTIGSNNKKLITLDDLKSIPATAITQDSTHRFVTDSEKSTWNAKTGKNVSGATYTIKDADGNDTQVTASAGAEVFNNYSNNKAIGYFSHAEGENTTASGHRSHAEGLGTTASGYTSHAEGWKTTASGLYSHAEGAETTASGSYSHAEGTSTTASGEDSHAEGSVTTALGDHSHAEGYGTTASGRISHAEGRGTIASGNGSHAEGGNYAHDGSSNMGNRIIYSSTYPEIESDITIKSSEARGHNSHAEGIQTLAFGYGSHAEGRSTNALGDGSHAEGSEATASGDYSHAEGYGALASGMCSHAEGGCWPGTINSGVGSVARGIFSHAEGRSTIASGDYQHVQGKFNIEDTADIYAHIVGNGTTNDTRSNAHTLDWDGNAWFSGDVYIGSTSGLNKDEGSKKLATEEYINIRVPAWTDEDEGKVLKIVNGTPTWV